MSSSCPKRRKLKTTSSFIDFDLMGGLQSWRGSNIGKKNHTLFSLCALKRLWPINTSSFCMWLRSWYFKRLIRISNTYPYSPRCFATHCTYRQIWYTIQFTKVIVVNDIYDATSILATIFRFLKLVNKVLDRWLGWAFHGWFHII